MENEKTTVRVSVALNQKLAKLGTIGTSMEDVIESILRLSNAEVDIKKFHKALVETKALRELKRQNKIKCPACSFEFVDDTQNDRPVCPSCGQEIVLSEIDNDISI